MLNLLHIIATWAVAISGTLSLVLLACWLFWQALEAIRRVFKAGPVMKEFALWYMDKKAKEKRTMPMEVEIPDPRRPLD